MELSNGALITADSKHTGQAGDIEIRTDELLQLENSGVISVNGGELGLPGDIDVQSKDIIFNHGGMISATTTQGKQGNIRLAGANLWLRDRSKIVTNATQDATGGNIFIDLADNLLVLDDSQIAASAEQGKGGNIQLSARGIFVSGDSEINASSKFGIDGLIRIDTFAVSPGSGLIRLPSKLSNPSRHLARGCSSVSSNRDNQFINVGKGGLPENPLTNVAQDSVLPDLSGFLSPTASSSSPKQNVEPVPNVEPIIEAQNWKMNQSGKIELIANSQSNNSNYRFETNGCVTSSQG